MRNAEKLVCYVCLDKLIYFLNSKMFFPVDSSSLYLFKLQFPYFGLLSWYRTIQNELFSGFSYLRIVLAFEDLPQGPTRWITRPSPIQCIIIVPKFFTINYIYVHILCVYIYIYIYIYYITKIYKDPISLKMKWLNSWKLNLSFLLLFSPLLFSIILGVYLNSILSKW